MNGEALPAEREPGALAAILRSPADLRLAARMLGWALVLPLLKCVVPLPRLAKLVRPAAPARPRDAARERRVVELAHHYYGRLSHPGTACLQRSLLVYRFLAEAGADPRLAVGLRKQQGEVVGHAWVTVGGELVGEPAESLRDFAPIFEAGGGGD